MKISNEAVQAAARGMQPTAGNHQVNCRTYMLQPFSECTCGIWANALFRARAALEAAAPYLEPAGDENAYHYSTEEIAAKIADRVPHADLDGFPLNQRLRIGKAVAPLFRELLPAAAAPAGDGGLREALERLCDDYSAIDIEMLRDTLDAHPAAPAVPLPVDREALVHAAHMYYCVKKDAPTHPFDQEDYDKADEILEILALLGGSVEKS